MHDATLRTAQHEAAHAIVACALGVTVLDACARGPEGHITFGPCDWYSSALIYAAGPACERMIECGPEEWPTARRWRAVGCAGDLRHMRLLLGRSQAPLRAAIRAAEGVLRGHAIAHARLTRALLTRGSLGATTLREHARKINTI